MRINVLIGTIFCISLLTLSAFASSLQVAKTQPSSSPAYLMYVTSTVQPSCVPHLPAISSSHRGSGPIIWNTILPASYPLVSIGNNGTQIFAESTYSDPGNTSEMVCFQLYATQGDGQALWQYSAHYTVYAQVDAAKERDVLVGLAVNNPLDTPEQPPFQRLYKWTSASSTPDWYFDIPLPYHVFQGGIVEHDLALSGDGTRVILAVTNTTNNLIQIFQFAADNGTLLTSYTLHLDAQDLAYVFSLDVSTDGSLVRAASFLHAFLVDLTTQTIRWISTSNCSLGAISGDGSTLVSFSGDNINVSIIILEWNATDLHYHERWRQPFLPWGWGLLGNEHSVDISEDGSTIIIGCEGNVYSPPVVQTKTILFDSQSGRLWENTTRGHGFDCIIDVRLSRTGGRAIVASTGDNLSSVDQLRVFDRNDSRPRFSIHVPWSLHSSVDITRDGAFATAAADTGPFSGGSILYSLNASGLEPTRNLTATFHGGKVFTIHVKNDDNETATDIPWTMYITGGILHQVSYRAFGTIPSIPGHQTVTTSSKRLIGFGRITAYVTINHAWYPVSGWIFGRYLFLTSLKNVI